MEILRAVLDYFEQHSALFTAIGYIAMAIGAIGGLIIQGRKKNAEIDRLHGKLDAAESKLNEKTHDTSSKIASLEQKLTHVTDRGKAMLNDRNRFAKMINEERAKHASEKAALTQHHQGVQQQLTEENEQLKDEINKKDAILKKHAWITKKMLELEGELWERRPLKGTPRFVPVQRRKMAIVSVLNLKGGVGKTTVTAHLGAAFAAKGYRVLLIDLDLQGSLTSLFMKDSDIAKAYRESMLLQHFFGNAARVTATKLPNYIHPILEGTRSGLVATSDKLAYAEMNLTMTWLLRLCKRDTRFLLRRALHQKRISRRYDLVLIDCPPLINTCCVNALAASDYVLAPVTPSQASIERVPLLITAVKKLSDSLNTNLKIAGVVFNKTFKQTLTSDESALWDRMMVHAQDALGSPLHGFNTVIRQTVEMRESDSDFVQPSPGSMLYEAFRGLAGELEERFPGECRRPDKSLEQLEPPASECGSVQAG